MKFRTTPQLSLPLHQPASEPRRATATWLDDSPFDPSEFDPEAAVAPALPVPVPRGPVFRPMRDKRPAAPAVPREHAQRLAGELRLLVGGAVRLHIHDNRSTMVSFRREQNLLHLRVHHMFLGAGPDVVRAIADYARVRSPRAGRVLDQFVRQHREHIRRPDHREVQARPLATRGLAHDLQGMFDSLNLRYFGRSIEARIGWGRGTTSRRRRSIRMGAYYHETRTILIHPALDRPDVPRYFVELVIFHEMLHQAVPQQRIGDGRRCVHSAEFRRRERLFCEYERGRAWERRHLSILLRPVRPPRR